MIAIKIASESIDSEAQLVEKALGQAESWRDCVYYGTPTEVTGAAELVFVGFWTDKGDSDAASSSFLERLRDKHRLWRQ